MRARAFCPKGTQRRSRVRGAACSHGRLKRPEVSFPGASGRSTALQTPSFRHSDANFRPTASRTGREDIPHVLSLPGCSCLLEQPREANTGHFLQESTRRGRVLVSGTMWQIVPTRHLRKTRVVDTWPAGQTPRGWVLCLGWTTMWAVRSSESPGRRHGQTSLGGGKTRFLEVWH